MPRKKSRKGYTANGNVTLLPKEYLEHVKSCAGTDCTPKMMKYGFFALKKMEIGKNFGKKTTSRSKK